MPVGLFCLAWRAMLLYDSEVAVADEAGGEGAYLVELDEDASEAFPTKEGAGDACEGSADDLYPLAIEVRGHGLGVDEDVDVLGLEDGAEIGELLVGYDEILIAAGFAIMEVVVIGRETGDEWIGWLGMDELVEFGTGGTQEDEAVVDHAFGDDLDGLSVDNLQ